VTPFDPPVAAASLSGRSDAEWARAAAPNVGAAFCGGIALDAPTRDAARDLVARDREEFLPPDPVAFVDRQLDRLAETPLVPGFNVRATTPTPVAEAAAVCADHGAVVEINAHCRQDEMCAVGCGEALLRDADRLSEQVAAASATGATVAVKCRAGVSGVDLSNVAHRAVAAGADLLHVDAMDDEPSIRAVADAVAAAPGSAAVIANNGVRDRATVREYAAYGADAVSVGRPSDDPAVLRRVRRAATDLLGPVAAGGSGSPPPDRPRTTGSEPPPSPT
jgi:TIM-barrel protein